MNERWNLDSLYHGFSDPNFTGDLQALKVACGRFDTFTKWTLLTPCARG